MGQCVGCVKYLLFIFNFALWLLGCALLSVGIWVKLDDSAANHVQELTEKRVDEYQISYNIIDGGDSTATFAYLLIIFGIVIIIITFIGCCGAVRENTCFLLVFAICLFVLMCSLIGVGIWAIAKKEDVGARTRELEDKTDSIVTKAVQHYHTDENSREFMDKLQEKYHCCGARGASADYAGRALPVTCRPDSRNRHCTNFYFHYVATQIEDFLKHRYSVLAGVCVAFGVIVGLGMVVTLLLCCLIRRASSARVS